MSTHDGALTLGALAESLVLALVESVVMSTHDGALTLGALAESLVLALVESVVMSTQSPSAPPLEP